MAIQNFDEIIDKLETHYGVELTDFAVEAYLGLFNQLGWTDEQLYEAAQLTIQLEPGFGRIPPAQVFVEHYTAKRRLEKQHESKFLALNPESTVRCFCCEDTVIVNPGVVPVLTELAPHLGVDPTFRYRCQRASCFNLAQELWVGNQCTISNRLTRQTCDILHDYLDNAKNLYAPKVAPAQEVLERMRKEALPRALDHLSKIQRCLDSEDLVERKWAEGALRVVIDQYPERYGITVKRDLTGVIAYQNGFPLELEATP